jgi:hypothetical protein
MGLKLPSKRVLSNRESECDGSNIEKTPEAVDSRALLPSCWNRDPLATGPICHGFFELDARPLFASIAPPVRSEIPKVILVFAPGDVAERLKALVC